ncbi:unnamed protein product [Polarella glacialis]|uniref:2Fe-2S ferredoxin-type domain-containing protein n=1 Tax=Polarella glacialis TaxID=89957 RepID=A0A813D6T0_POLGL|nr:unnamed protein product [Polarella glacialis]
MRALARALPGLHQAGGRRLLPQAALPGRLTARSHVNGTPTAEADVAENPAAARLGFVTVHFLDPNVDGLPRRLSVKAAVGSSIVDVAKEHGVDIHAACGQKLQCATCHVILKQPFYEQLNKPGVREEDLLDSTFTLTSTSRLGCQIRLTPELDGIECTLPDNSDKGNVRMSLEQPRNRVMQQFPGMKPAVAPKVTASSGNMAAHHAASGSPGTPGPTGLWHAAQGGAGKGAGEPEEVTDELGIVQKQLIDQLNLTARLELELRLIRSNVFRQDVKSGKGAGSAAASNATDNSGNSKGKDEDDDLAKIKADLKVTRVDVSKLGRRASFKDVIGLEEAKTALQEAIIWPAVAHQSLFSGVRGSPKGLLLYGPPGCGKTMLARAAAVELDERASFFHVRPGDVMSKFYGESQRRVQALEELVQESAPAVVFFDEVDSLLGSRDGGGVAEHHRSTTNALLAWMDGFGTGDERVFFLGATNRPEAIDEAALRRFGDAVEVGTPSIEARHALIRHLVLQKAGAGGHLASLSDSDMEAISERTAGFSLADVDRLVRKAFLQVLRELPSGIKPGLRPEDVPPVTIGHFLAALEASSGTSALREMLKKRAGTRAAL